MQTTQTPQTTSKVANNPTFSEEELAQYAELFADIVVKLFIFSVSLDMKRLGFTDLQQYIGYILFQHPLQVLNKA